MRHLAFAILFLCSVLVSAKGRSGPEWTFTNSELIKLGQIKDINSLPNSGEGHDRLQRKLLSRWKSEIKALCPKCKVKTFGSRSAMDKFQVYISDDIWFEVSRDPWVLEVKASPMDLETFDQFSDEFQKLVWGAANSIGIKPDSRIGGGHIHLEIQSFFGQDKLLFRNFLVDLANHPELFLGALGFDLLNAPPIAVLSGKQKQAFERVIMEFDQGKMSIAELISKINFEVYSETFYDPYLHQQNNPEKYQAVNLLHELTLELRGLNPQADARTHFLLLKLFEARIEYLKLQNGPIPVRKVDYSTQVNSYSVRKMDIHTSIIDPNIIIKKARSYIEGSGLKWSDYSDLIAVNVSQVSTGAGNCKTSVGL